jgi:predicted RecB family endonuclease
MFRFLLQARSGQAGTSGGTPRNVADLVDSAASYVLYELGVEVVRFKRPAELCEYLATLTRLIAGRVADDQVVVTEIDCVAK